MADILNDERGSKSGNIGMPVLPIADDYPLWWERIHTLTIVGKSIVAQCSATGFPDGKPLADRALTIEEWKAFYCALHNEFKAFESDLKDGVFEIRCHHGRCRESHSFFCSIQLDGKIARSKSDNIVAFDGEQMHLPVLSRNATHTTGRVTLAGQQFPVWRWEENRIWYLGSTPDAEIKTSYYIDATMQVKYGGKKERAALAFLKDKGLLLFEEQQGIRLAYVGYVCLTHAEYGQAMEMDKHLHLQNR